MAAAAAATVLALAPGSSAALEGRDLELYRTAFRHAEAGRFDAARKAAAEARDRLPAKVIEWMDLSRPETMADFGALSAFIDGNPDWPSLAVMRRRAEATMPPAMPAEAVRAWFERRPPLSVTGVMRHAEALVTTGDTVAATQIVRQRWVNGAFSVGEEQEFRARYGAMLRPDEHWARLDRLLWDGEVAAARRVMDVVDPGRRALAEARLRIARDPAGADAALATVPEALRSDAGLHFERLRAARRRDRDAEAMELLLDAPPQLGRATPWWTERNLLVRRAMDRAEHALAYRLATDHGQHTGAAFAEGEFLAGWLALRSLDQPQTAFRHFERMYRNVTTPLSISRAAYWAGRATEAMSGAAEARPWYERSAVYPTTFYGQLAGRTLGRTGLPLPVDQQITQAAATAFERRELVRVVRALVRIQRAEQRGDPPASERAALFLRRLQDAADTPMDHALVARIALEVGRQDVAVATARAAVQHEVTLLSAGYPRIPLPADRPEPALLHAIIRQESVFNAGAVSPAGARGLMQLMPATAQQVAGKLGLRHTQARLTADPGYNVQLGSAYLAEMIERFNGSYVLAVAAYNAGPGRVRQWLQRYGDPRAEGVDVIDWIETIPFNETRNYVQRVLEGLQVYRQRLGGADAPLRIVEDLRR